MVNKWARMSPSTVPSTWMSPVVLMLPVTCKSWDKTDAGGFAFGADGGGAAAVVGAAGFAASSLGAGSLILLLENIFSSLQIFHGVNRITIHTDFIM